MALNTYRDLRTYQHALDLCVSIFEMMRHPEKWVLQKKMPGKPSDEKATAMGMVS